MRLLNDFDPMTPVEQIRYDLAHELLDDVERLDAQLKVSHRRIKEAVQASGTSLTDLYGVGPILACALTGYTGDVRRFGNRDQFASYAGVAPIGGAMSDEHCPGCGATTPVVAGPVHAYIPASPGCWSLFCSLTDWMQSLAVGDGSTIAQQVVDSYMVQHAANPERRNRQSVAVHLISLCASLEHRVPGDELRNLLGKWTHRDYPELLPRPSDYEITVEQIFLAEDPDRQAAVGAWARSAWDAWGQHHEVISGWFANSAGG